MKRDEERLGNSRLDLRMIVIKQNIILILIKSQSRAGSGMCWLNVERCETNCCVSNNGQSNNII